MSETTETETWRKGDAVDYHRIEALRRGFWTTVAFCIDEADADTILREHLATRLPVTTTETETWQREGDQVDNDGWGWYELAGVTIRMPPEIGDTILREHQIAQAWNKSMMDELLLKDRGKTNEINILTAENKALKADLKQQAVSYLAAQAEREKRERELEAERDELIREFGQFKNEVRDERSAHFAKVQELRAELDQAQQTLQDTVALWRLNKADRDQWQALAERYRAVDFIKPLDDYGVMVECRVCGFKTWFEKDGEAQHEKDCPILLTDFLKAAAPSKREQCCCDKDHDYLDHQKVHMGGSPLRGGMTNKCVSCPLHGASESRHERET